MFIKSIILLYCIEDNELRPPLIRKKIVLPAECPRDVNRFHSDYFNQDRSVFHSDGFNQDMNVFHDGYSGYRHGVTEGQQSPEQEKADYEIFQRLIEIQKF